MRVQDWWCSGSQRPWTWSTTHRDERWMFDRKAVWAEGFTAWHPKAIQQMTVTEAGKAEAWNRLCFCLVIAIIFNYFIFFFFAGREVTKPEGRHRRTGKWEGLGAWYEIPEEYIKKLRSKKVFWLDAVRLRAGEPAHKHVSSWQIYLIQEYGFALLTTTLQV